MKHIRIAVAGSLADPIDFLLCRGITSGSVLRQLKLEEYTLFALPTSGQTAYPLLASQEVYPEVVGSGDPLLAVLTSEAEGLSMRLVAYADSIFSTPQPEEETTGDFMKLVIGGEEEPA